jgi:hypothetical protein
MRLSHAAALALVAWYPMIPPMKRGGLSYYTSTQQGNTTTIKTP